MAEKPSPAPRAVADPIVGSNDVKAFGRRVYPAGHPVNLILRAIPPRLPASELAARLRDVLAVADVE